MECPRRHWSRLSRELHREALGLLLHAAARRAIETRHVGHRDDAHALGHHVGHGRVDRRRRVVDGEGDRRRGVLDDKDFVAEVGAVLRPEGCCRGCMVYSDV